MAKIHLAQAQARYAQATGTGTEADPASGRDHFYSEPNAKEYAAIAKTGDGIIEGQAFLRQRGGGMVTAAGETVYLIPYTSLSDEWASQGGLLFDEPDFLHSLPDSQPFRSTMRTTTADASGSFRFDKLPRGGYFLRTEVRWEVAGEPQGGVVYVWAVLSGPHEKKTVVLHSPM